MTQERLQNLYRSNPVIAYFRVSTKKQVKSEYKNQIAKIKEVIPEFKLNAPNTKDYREVISGKADKEKRIGGQLGTVLRQLKHDPHLILFVSSFDRIGRRVDIFELIQTQGLGHRIFSTNCLKSLDEMMSDGDHHLIAKRTKSEDRRRQAGILRRKESGAELGNPSIRMHAHKGAATQIKRAQDRSGAVLATVVQLSKENRGKSPSHEQICDRLDESEIRTGQGRPFTSARLSQFKKQMKKEWRYAADSYNRPRRRIQMLIQQCRLEILYKRIKRQRLATPAPYASVVSAVRAAIELFLPSCLLVRVHWYRVAHHQLSHCFY